MAKGRPPDPTRARRGTGHRPQAGQARAAKTSVVDVVATPVRSGRKAPPPDPYPPPDELPTAVHGVWRQVVDDLGGAGHMRPAFLPVVEAYCRAVWMHAQAARQVETLGLLVKGANGQAITNPLIKVQKDAAATMLRYAQDLGLTPAARIRLALGEVVGMSILQSLNASLDAKG